MSYLRLDFKCCVLAKDAYFTSIEFREVGKDYDKEWFFFFSFRIEFLFFSVGTVGVVVDR